MRIGLVLFGHLRSYRQTLSSFETFLKTLQRSGDVDVFCHTWNIEESVTASWWKENKPGDIPPPNVNANEIEDKYQPVRYIIEPSRQFDDSGYTVKSPIPVAGILSMLHSQQQAFQLLEQYSIENNVSYDVVIKLRYDLLYEIAPEFSELVNRCSEEDCLYLPTSNPFELGGSFSDVFVVGPMKLVKIYFSFVPNFKNAINSYHQKGYKEFLPELCLTEYLREKKISIKELTGLRIHILRLSGDTFQINAEKNFPGNTPLCFFRDSIEANKRMNPDQAMVIINRGEKLAKKYTSWIDNEADNDTLQLYADFYNGAWIEISQVKKLAIKGRDQSVFGPNVMKNFFEEALRNSKYNSARKFLIASTLARSSGYGFFFYRVWRKITFGKN